MADIKILVDDKEISLNETSLKQYGITILKGNTDDVDAKNVVVIGDVEGDIHCEHNITVMGTVGGQAKTESGNIFISGECDSIRTKSGNVFKSSGTDNLTNKINEISNQIEMIIRAASKFFGGKK